MTRVIALVAIAAALAGWQPRTCHPAHRTIHVNGQTEKYPEARCTKG